MSVLQKTASLDSVKASLSLGGGIVGSGDSHLTISKTAAIKSILKKSDSQASVQTPEQVSLTHSAGWPAGWLAVAGWSLAHAHTIYFHSLDCPIARLPTTHLTPSPRYPLTTYLPPPYIG